MSEIQVEEPPTITGLAFPDFTVLVDGLGRKRAEYVAWCLTCNTRSPDDVVEYTGDPGPDRAADERATHAALEWAGWHWRDTGHVEFTWRCTLPLRVVPPGLV
ncbi:MULTISPECIES: hypothetical protein [unclassified Streptomyces]|uniref:hypothetical protein n=1 Tax=unclassified Streptomyces TaxID=2593676 RepID=UPI0002000E63|nr:MULTISPECIES: hypothetical protein [unclassified Streptomyces]MYQ60069.1 hypothetical protein [Streptomyces sp. SID4926]SCD98474.1 hypothetical protein GA0115252_126216 [Streptomyces sp. DfronAA-171]